MSSDPIIPSRIIPASAPLPERSPSAGELPPWRTSLAPPAPPAPPQPPTRFVFLPPPPPPPSGPIEVHVRLLPVELPPEPTRWERLWSWITSIARPWQICAALTGALIPIPGVGYSAAGIWAYCVDGARDQFGAGWAYAIALVSLYLAGRAVHRTRRLRALVACTICLIGVTGAIHLYDPVTALTGVHPR